VWIPDVRHLAEPEYIGVVLSNRVAGPVSKDRDVFAHESPPRCPMEILQISIRRLSVVNAAGATDSSGDRRKFCSKIRTGSYRMRRNRSGATRKPASAAQSIGRRLTYKTG
jgi:hypothetical protein